MEKIVKKKKNDGDKLCMEKSKEKKKIKVREKKIEKENKELVCDAMDTKMIVQRVKPMRQTVRLLLLLAAID